MESAGECFLNKSWIITKWTADPEAGLDDWLVQKGAALKITLDEKGDFHVQWPNQAGSLCTLSPPLQLQGEELATPLKASVEIEAGPKRVSLAGATVKLQVVVSFDNFGEGNTGTFTADARPVGDDGNGAG
jgi:hypothetical protein